MAQGHGGRIQSLRQWYHGERCRIDLAIKFTMKSREVQMELEKSGDSLLPKPVFYARLVTSFGKTLIIVGFSLIMPSTAASHFYR